MHSISSALIISYPLRACYIEDHRSTCRSFPEDWTWPCQSSACRLAPTPPICSISKTVSVARVCVCACACILTVPFYFYCSCKRYRYWSHWKTTDLRVLAPGFTRGLVFDSKRVHSIAAYFPPLFSVLFYGYGSIISSYCIFSLYLVTLSFDVLSLFIFLKYYGFLLKYFILKFFSTCRQHAGVGCER